MTKSVRLGFSGILLCFLVLLAIPEGAGAIPAFARKYGTSCQTCHVAYPKLTPFGEAFRQNGFQWPGDMENEEANVKDKSVPLGAKAYKRVFPHAVWPGAIPGKVPLSFRARSGVKWENGEDGSLAEFELPTLQAMMAGTLGDNVGFFVGAHLFEEGDFGHASVDRFYLKLNNVLSGTLPDHLLYVRFGQFIPEMVTFASNHRGLTLTSYAYNTYSPSAGPEFPAEHVHGNQGHDEAEGDGHVHSDVEKVTGPQFGIENFQLGVEASGLMRGRFRYVVGLVNGGTGHEENQAKDGYFRLAYKLGGMAYDGSGGAGMSGKNWVDNSVAVGLFGYRGLAFNEFTLSPKNLEIRRLGVDLNGFVGNLNLYGGFLLGSDELLKENEHDHAHEDPEVEAPVLHAATTDFSLYFAEANYVLYPWLIGVLRYEQASPGEYDTIRRLVPSVTLLYRANIKFVLESRFDLDNLDFSVLQIGLDFAY
ncbi:MAG: hypothetical protein ACE5GH_01025 [Fidelibacterota bacterium]